MDRVIPSQDYEFVMYMQNPNSLTIRNNHLRIMPIESEEIFGNGFVTSRDGFNYGNK